MNRRLRSNWDLLALSAAVLVCVAVVAFVSFPPAQILAAVFLELVAPGYAISAAVFSRREISAAEFLLCCLGTSLVVAALGGVLLDQLPGEMGQAAWLVLLAAVTLLAVAAALALAPLEELPRALGRSSGLPKAGADELEERFGLPRWLNLTLGALTALLVVSALVIARDAVRESPGFSELSAVPVTSSGKTELVVTVSSHQKQDASYELAIDEESETGDSRSQRSLRLGPGQSRSLSAPVDAGAKRVIVILYRAGERRPYLRTSYFPPVADTASGAAG